MSAVPLRGLPDDRQAQAGARQHPGLRRAVEAVEDQGQVLVGDARAIITDDQAPVDEVHPNSPLRRAPLDGIVEQVGHGTLQGLWFAAYEPWLQGHLEPHRPGPAAYPLHRPADDLRHVDGLVVAVQGLVAGQLHQVADESGQLLDLRAHVGEQLGARLGRQSALLVGLGQQVQIGPQ